MHRFGFGTPTGIDLPGEEQGIVLHASQYSGSSMGNLPMGQGESVTPIQMATAYAAIANGGVLRPPHIVEAIGGKPATCPPATDHLAGRRRASCATMLRGVFADGGTASGAAIPGYDLAGKTGTANVVVHGKYSNTDYVASFIGFVPASIRGCSSRSWSTSRRARSTAARSPRRRSRRSSAGQFRISGSHPGRSPPSAGGAQAAEVSAAGGVTGSPTELIAHCSSNPSRAGSNWAPASPRISLIASGAERARW